MEDEEGWKAGDVTAESAEYGADVAMIASRRVRGKDEVVMWGDCTRRVLPRCEEGT